MNLSTICCIPRTALIFLGMVLYFSTVQAQNNDKTLLQNGDTLHLGNKILRFSLVSKGDFEKAPGVVYIDKEDERHNINADAKRVIRRKDSLILTNKDGRAIVFRNRRGSVSNDEREKYYFLDNLKEDQPLADLCGICGNRGLYAGRSAKWCTDFFARTPHTFHQAQNT